MPGAHSHHPLLPTSSQSPTFHSPLSSHFPTLRHKDLASISTKVHSCSSQSHLRLISHLTFQHSAAQQDRPRFAHLLPSHVNSKSPSRHTLERLAWVRSAPSIRSLGQQHSVYIESLPLNLLSYSYCYDNRQQPKLAYLHTSHFCWQQCCLQQ